MCGSLDFKRPNKTVHKLTLGLLMEEGADLRTMLRRVSWSARTLPQRLRSWKAASARSTGGLDPTQNFPTTLLSVLN
jgi:hypothetical protein